MGIKQIIMSYTKKQMEEYNLFINKLCEKIIDTEMSYSQIRDIADRLHRYETTLHRIAEIWCNDDLSEYPKEQERIERHEESIEKKVRDIVKLFHNADVSFEGDPRGGTIRIKFNDGSSNCFCDDGTWGIYW